MEKLTPEEYLILADVIGDMPETLCAADCLKQGRCHAYVFGSLPEVSAVLIIDTLYIENAFCFATDVNALWHLLESQSELECLNINVDPLYAETLGQHITAKIGGVVKYYAEIHHALLEPVRCYPNEAVRLLTLADVEHLAKAPAVVPGYSGDSFEISQRMITTGTVAAAIVSDSIISIAHTYAHTDLHVGISVFTLEEWRGKGFATASASLVAQQIQAMGKVPVWSCGDNNVASLRTAQKLGFVEVSKRINIIPTSS